MSESPEEELKTDDWGDSIEWDETDELNISLDKGINNWGISPNLGETYMVLFKDKKLFLGSVNNVENEDGKYFTLKNNSKSLLFETEETGIIKMKTDDYEILDIKRLKKYDMKMLELPESIEEKLDKTSDIAYSLIDHKDHIYTRQELKEILVSTLYSQYNDKTIIKSMKEIIEYAEILIDLSGEDLIKKRKISNWCIPIITNETKIIPEENEIINEIKELNENDMLITDKNTKNDKNYISLMKNLLHSWDNILHNESDEGVIINDYEGKMYRNCMNMKNCSGINGLYSFDEIKNNRELKIPTTFDRSTGDSNFVQLRKPMKINIIGVLTVPYNYFPFLSDSFLNMNNLTLYEKCIFQDLIKQTNTHKRETFKKQSIISKSFQNQNYKYELDRFIIHLLNSKDKNELIDDIESMKPTIEELFKIIDDRIINSINNYKDISKLLVNYEIDNLDINKGYKIVNDILKKNVRNAIKNSRVFNLKHKKIVKKELTIEKRIELSRNIIFGMLNISSRNSLIKRFIDTFCVETTEDTNWYYGIHDKKRLLCKHYSYLSKNNEESFFMMKQKYQKLPVIDGNIYCKNCGEFICREEFSHDDGFVGDMPASTKEILIQDKDLFEKYDESEMNNIGLLKDISQGLGVDMKDDDLILINDIYISLSEDIIANKRYNTTNITTSDEHPRVKEIKKLKKDKKMFTKATKSFQIFLKVTNRILIFISLSLIVIATNIPSYENKYIKDFKLFYNDKKLNKDFIDKILLVMKRLSHTFGEKYDKIFTELLNEKKSYDILSVSEQIQNLIYFFLSSNFPKILKIYNDYSKFLNIKDNLYIKYEWPIFKPLSKNKLILGINEVVQNDKISEKYLLKTYNHLNIENITSVSALDEYDIHNTLNIKNNELINTAFQRLFNISISLYGKLEKPNFYIDTNVEKFYDSSSDEIKEICIKSGWNNTKKTMGPVNFKELRKKLIPNIIKNIYKTNADIEPCFTIKENCNDLIHININNYDLQMINVNDKRFYYHQIPDIFPSVNFSAINDEIKDKIFNTFAFDPSNNIIKREYNQKYLGKFIIDIENIIDIDIEDKREEYEKNIPRNEKNFHKIISFMHDKSCMEKLYINIPTDIDNDTIKEFLNSTFINEYHYLLDISEFSEMKNIIDILSENKSAFKEIQKDLNTILLKIENKIDEILKIIGENMIVYFDKYPKLREDFQLIFVPGIKNHISVSKLYHEKLESYGSINYRKLNETNIENIFKLLIEDETFDFEYIKDISNDILFILANIINSGYKNSHVPKSWRLSETNKDWFKKYIDTHYFSQHKDIYKKTNFKDFSKYFNVSKKRFIDLFFNIKYIVKNIDLQRNTDDIILTKNIKSLWKYIFLNIIKELLIFTSSIQEDSEIDEEKEDDIENIESFSMDIITHLFEKRYDLTWIYSNKSILNELLSSQKEREKQKLIHKLDGMTNDKRYATTELHTIGTKNYFKASEIENMEHIEDDNYKNANDDLSYINQLMNGETIGETNLVVENDLLNDNYDTGDFIDDDGGNMD